MPMEDFRSLLVKPANVSLLRMSALLITGRENGEED